MAKLPKTYETFRHRYPKIWEAYDHLGLLTHPAGLWDEKTRELIKLALSVGARLEGAVHSHARRAIQAGATPEEIRSVVLLGLTTLGFPSTMAALTWVEDILTKRRNRSQGR